MSAIGVSADESAKAGRNAFLFIFGGALFLSATLLFAVQPMFTKMVLPKLGGAPGVWSVALVFFQGVLLAGYAYAHFLTRHVGARLGAFAHVAVLVLGFAFLPLTLAEDWGKPPEDRQIVYLLGLFGVSIGLPFFALSANAPLLQAWYARTDAPGRNDPYFLYGASNLGSFIALLGYPFVIEPGLRLVDQTWWWSASYCALAVWISAIAFYANRNIHNVQIEQTVSLPTTLAQRARWVFLAFVPSALLVAVTSHISTDIASAPFLWVIPLALFLLTFVLVFREKPLVRYHILAILLPASLVYVVVDWLLRGLVPTVWLIGLHLFSFFIAAMVAHSRLYAFRPSSDRLTEFYLWMSFGGVLGGAFAALVAPSIFPTVLEYPILLVLSALTLVHTDRVERQEIFVTFLIVCTALLIALYAVITDTTIGLGQERVYRSVIVIPAAATLLFVRMWPLASATILGAMLLVCGLTAPRSTNVYMSRSFFGVHKIQDYRSGVFRVLYHGTTLHGATQLENGVPRPGWPEPLTYYHTQSPMAEIIRAVREANDSVRLSPAGIVGLGSGSLACYRQEGENWHFYEIDTSVVHIARDSGYFRFLPTCAPDARIHIGDARITLGDSDLLHELLLIDAFSSDAIPIHLMTREAIQLYFQRLTPNGVLVLHISNRHLALLPEVGALARELDLQAIWKQDEPTADYGPRLLATSLVVALAKEEGAFGALPSLEGWRKLESDPEKRAWTDDYSDIVGAFRRNIRLR